MPTPDRLLGLLVGLDAAQVAHNSGPTDFRDPAVVTIARSLADQLIQATDDADELWALEQAVARTSDDHPDRRVTRLGQLAIKLARSRAFFLATRPSVFVSIVVPAYGENVRLLPRGSEPGRDPHGEDFVLQKSAQLEWLVAGTGSGYEVVVVDDMSKPEPVTSGAAITAVVTEHQVPHWRVLHLTDGVTNDKDGTGVVAASLRHVEIPKNTRKAGAVYFGAAKAIEARGTGSAHVIAVTDCDLSVDLGQLGNLVAPIVTGAVAAAGSRRLPESLLEIEPGRNTRANAARYFREILLKGLLPRDTQCGAKAFSADALGQVIEAGLDIMDFSFDIELLTKLALRFGADLVVPVPVAWFDSSELTTTDSSVHYGIMRSQLSIALVNETGAGKVFDDAVAVARKLLANESVWLGFLDRLAADSDLLRAMETFDTGILADLDRLAILSAETV
jgi:hypothetical protein